MQGGGGEGRQRRSSTEGWKQDLSCPFLSFVFPEGPSRAVSHSPACCPNLTVASLLLSEALTVPLACWVTLGVCLHLSVSSSADGQ